ncbi:glycerophosphoryl diester phosphodiesterase membrane domain-containing protein [Streptomonospora sediminis]
MVALRPLTLGDVFNGAFGYIRQNPKTTLGLALIVTALFNIVNAIGTGGYLSNYATEIQAALEPAGAAAPAPFDPWATAAVYAGALIAFLGQVLLTGLLAAVVGLAVLGRKLTMREALAAVRGRLAAVFGVAALLFLLGLLWTVLLMAAIFGAVLLGVAVHPFVGVLVGLFAFPALIVLAVWVYVRTALAMPVAVLESAGPGSALARSWRLTQRSWWRLFGILLLAQFLASLVANLLATPFNGGAAVLSFLAPDAAWMPVAATAAAFVGIVLSGTLSTPFIVGVTTLLYIDLRMRREGLDLKLQAAAQSGEHVDAGIYRPDPAAQPAQPAQPGQPGQPGGPQHPEYPAQPGQYGPQGQYGRQPQPGQPHPYGQDPHQAPGYGRGPGYAPPPADPYGAQSGYPHGDHPPDGPGHGGAGPGGTPGAPS